MNMFYSPASNSCYAGKYRGRYEANGTWPADAVPIDDELYAAVFLNRPASMLVVPGASGLPELAELPEALPLTLEQVQATRLQAYRVESDPLKIEAEYDALSNGTEPDYAAWVLKVEEIKARYPLPG